MTTAILEQVRLLPQEPGIYRFFNAAGDIIYIGKAKSLKNRVSSYFANLAGHSRKTKRLVSEIDRLEYMVVSTESDALLLENNLIKQHQPKYNILLKDDKTYPYICVTQEPFPRVFYTRKIDNPKDRYFGPYASVKAMHAVLDLVRRLYTIRTCSFFMDDASIAEGKHKVCLEYHIKNCQGPCEGHQSRRQYADDIEQVLGILKGRLSKVKAHCQQQMQEAAAALDFERAQFYKDRAEALEKFQNKSLVAHPGMPDVDAFSIVSDEQYAYVNFLKITDGCISQTQSIEVRKQLDEPDEEVLAHAVLSLREKFNSEAKRVVANIELGIDLPGIDFHVPKIGDLKKIVELSAKNALYFKKERLQTKVDQQQDKQVPFALLQLKEDLQLKDLPRHIECFDNSNIQGTSPVASMVCFKNGKPSKRDYRKFNIKTVVGPDDFASMREVVGRRYARLLEEGEPLPDLIVIDGGKGQLSAACQALKEAGLYGQVPIVGIAKRLEEIYYPEDQVPVHIGKRSKSLELLQQVRDEAHRFAITFHRQVRSAGSLGSELDGISGIGPSTVEKLLRHFKSVKQVKAAGLPELEAVVGRAKAALLHAQLHGTPE
jgi:excinuclease ABC subunit C